MKVILEPREPSYTCACGRPVIGGVCLGCGAVRPAGRKRTDPKKETK